MRPTVRYAVFVALGIGAAIVAVAGINVLRLGSRQIMVPPIAPPLVDERRGTDERISVENYVEMIRFYETLIRHAAGV
jgi:hypothetical protein